MFAALLTRRRTRLPRGSGRAVAVQADVAERGWMGVRSSPRHAGARGFPWVRRRGQSVSPSLIGRMVLLPLLHAAPLEAHVLFGEPGADWAVLADNGEVRLRLREIAGVQPADVAISPDGKRWAVATQDERPELLLLTDLEAPPRRLRARGNVLDGLRFSDDGEWVYFSSNDDKQPRFENQPMLYAQVYRVRFDRGEPERLSLSRGCHMWPKPVSTGGVVVSHATCMGGRSLEILNVKTGKERVLLPETQNIGETAPLPEKQKILYTRATPAGTEFRVWDLPTGTSTLWALVSIGSARTRPQWVDGGNALLFQNGSRVWKLDAHGNTQPVLDLRGTR